jgi:DnaJ-class molecular chaperone
MARKDYYRVLGVQETATGKAIERAYWDLARTYHKKSARNKSAKRRLVTLNEAYENLASPDKRDAYDLERRRPRESQAGGGLRSLLQRFRRRYSEPQIPEP